MSQSTFTPHENVAPPSEAAPTPQVQTGPSRGRFRGAIPTVVVFGLLVLIAFWGHATDWSFTAAASTEKSDSANANACIVGGESWCKEHNVPEANCIECKKDLVPALHDYGWCAQHGIAECPLDHPDIAQLKETPQVSREDIERADRALAVLPRAENSSHCKHYQTRIQFASTEAIEKAGIDIAVVDRAPMLEAIAANGEIVYDQTHLAHLSSRVSGFVWKVVRQVGQDVRKGDVLALVDSTEVGRAKADFLQAITQLRLKQENWQRLQTLVSDGAIPGKQVREADAAMQEAQIRLLGATQTLTNLGLTVDVRQFDRVSTDQIAQQIQFLGVPDLLLADLDAGTTSNLFPIRSPLNGVVVDCKIIAGESVDPANDIFEVADISHMWLMLDVRQEDASHIALGQTVLFQPSDFKGEPIKGAIDWISTSTDDKTRTVKVRVDLPNPNRKLRANTFGTGRIVLRDEPNATVIPTEAVHTDGDCNIVFVRDKNFFKEDSPKFFHIREVRLGAKDGNNTEVIAGLLPGEVVAAKNSMVLEAQLLKSNLGEGCGCCSPGKK